ncbi:MAG: galactokinase [Bacteroidetes bacterium]|nr:MAG: galactokinase [Bacteroidota bacterium]
MNPILIEDIRKTFKKKFGKVSVLVNSPGRINFIGEHTDYNEGFVFPAAIDKGIVTAFSKSTTRFCTAYAFDKNESYKFLLEEIIPVKNGSWRNYLVGVVAEIQKKVKNVEPFNIVFGGDIPEGAGLSSSASLENSIVFGLNELFKMNLSKSEMILISQKAEHNFVGVRCGIMDQYASMFGVENHALFLDCRSQESIPFKIHFEDYQLVLINTNVSHNLVDAAYNERRSVCEKVVSLLQIKALRDATEESLMSIKESLSEDDYQKALYIIQENIRVQKAAQMIRENNLIAFGNLLFQAHDGAQNQFKISCPELDFLVELAKEDSNVIGARMMGGGFGGCTINIIANNSVKSFTKKASEAYLKKFGIECSIYFVKLSKGTHLTHRIYQE